MTWQVYLSGEIHTDWRERIERGAAAAGLDVRFTAPVTDHAASDAAGTAILGEQESRFWNDHLGAGVNAIRTTHNPPAPELLELADRMGIGVPLVGDFHYIGHKLLADHPACYGPQGSQHGSGGRTFSGSGQTGYRAVGVGSVLALGQTRCLIHQAGCTSNLGTGIGVLPFQ